MRTSQLHTCLCVLQLFDIQFNYHELWHKLGIIICWHPDHGYESVLHQFRPLPQCPLCCITSRRRSEYTLYQAAVRQSEVIFRSYHKVCLRKFSLINKNITIKYGIQGSCLAQYINFLLFHWYQKSILLSKCTEPRKRDIKLLHYGSLHRTSICLPCNGSCW